MKLIQGFCTALAVSSCNATLTRQQTTVSSISSSRVMHAIREPIFRLAESEKVSSSSLSEYLRNARYYLVYSNTGLSTQFQRPLNLDLGIRSRETRYLQMRFWSIWIWYNTIEMENRFGFYTYERSGRFFDDKLKIYEIPRPDGVGSIIVTLDRSKLEISFSQYPINHSCQVHFEIDFINPVLGYFRTPQNPPVRASFYVFDLGDSTNQIRLDRTFPTDRGCSVEY